MSPARTGCVILEGTQIDFLICPTLNKSFPGRKKDITLYFFLPGILSHYPGDDPQSYDDNDRVFDLELTRQYSYLHMNNACIHLDLFLPESSKRSIS